MTTTETIIDSHGTSKSYWLEIWRYRELVYFLSWRDILVRYKQTIIGAAWAILRPVMTMAIFTMVFGRLAKLPSEVPYPILVYAAMLPWQFFATALVESSNSIIENGNLLTKVYFPRLIVPISSTIVGIIDFALAFVVLLGLMAWYRFVPSWRMVCLPTFAILAFLAALGAGFWLSALNAKYRDFRYVIPFIVQFGLLVSPVGFSSSVVPESWRFWYSLNPIVGVIDGFRWAILAGTTPLYVPSVVISIAVTITIFFTGLRYFRTVERGFADVI
jgi:homopolymeric O-antigen transport system permease protein